MKSGRTSQNALDSNRAYSYPFFIFLVLLALAILAPILLYALRSHNESTCTYSTRKYRLFVIFVALMALPHIRNQRS